MPHQASPSRRHCFKAIIYKQMLFYYNVAKGNIMRMKPFDEFKKVMRKWFDFSKKEIVRIADLGNSSTFYH